LATSENLLDQNRVWAEIFHTLRLFDRVEIDNVVSLGIDGVGTCTK
jgi:hypothetical protein